MLPSQSVRPGEQRQSPGTSTQAGSPGSNHRGQRLQGKGLQLLPAKIYLKRAKPTNCPQVSGLVLGGDSSLAATGHRSVMPLSAAPATGTLPLSPKLLSWGSG